MTEKELINYLSSYERFVDDDYGGYYESIIQFSDGKLERALTSMSALRIIDEFNKLQQENKELKKQLKIKHNGFMASVDESCDLAKENQKYKEVIDKAIMYVNSTRYSDINGLQKYSIKEFWFIKELEDILNEVE